MIVLCIGDDATRGEGFGSHAHVVLTTDCSQDRCASCCAHWKVTWGGWADRHSSLCCVHGRTARVYRHGHRTIRVLVLVFPLDKGNSINRLQVLHWRAVKQQYVICNATLLQHRPTSPKAAPHP